MSKPARPHLLGLTALALASLTTCGGSDDAKPVQLACASVTTASLNLPGLVVASAAKVAASGAAGSAASYPAHCQITGKINQSTGIDAQP
jgi:hypothetical protein